MALQLDIFGNENEVKAKPTDKEKRAWENAFQRWSNKKFLDDYTPHGTCGYSSICDYCNDNSYGRPCIRALNKMCREKQITIDYSNRNFEEIWNM